MLDPLLVTCPYCFETVEVFLEPDVAGELVWDCEVCCNPWQLTVRRGFGGDVEARAERLSD
ncbi:MAG TPA: CPXCG motif-containing cysteine-rich protein [Thermoanaerobaculia bacterium]|nr:CPXCG motif-containing cysteine-rich protein [Thermoanaerobaculia bacterium]